MLYDYYLARYLIHHMSLENHILVFHTHALIQLMLNKISLCHSLECVQDNIDDGEGKKLLLVYYYQEIFQ